MGIRETEIVQRHTAFWRRGQTDRPIGTCWIGSRLPDELYSAAGGIATGLVRPSDVDVRAFAEDYERLYRSHSSIEDDSFWAASPFFGIPWVEAIIGCPVYYSGATFWVEPIWSEWPRDIHLPLHDGEEWAAKLLEFTAALVERAHGRYGVATTLMRGPADLAAAIRGHEAMIYDLYDHPRELKTLIEEATAKWIDVARRQLDLIPRIAGGYVSNFYRVWAPDRIVFSQEDASASYSPASLQEFLVPADRRITSAFPYSIMHVHSPTVWPVDRWLEVESLSCIEINYDNNGPRLPELLPVLKRIQEVKPLIIRGELTVDEIAYVKRHLSPAGLLLNLCSETEEGAREQMRALRSTRD